MLLCDQCLANKCTNNICLCITGTYAGSYLYVKVFMCRDLKEMGTISTNEFTVVIHFSFSCL